MCFVFIWEETATCATYSINWLVFITDMKSVYSAVRTGSSNKEVCASSLKGYSSQYILAIHCFQGEINSIKLHRTTSRIWRMNAEKTDVSWTLVVLVSRDEEEGNRFCLIWWNNLWYFSQVCTILHALLPDPLPFSYQCSPGYFVLIRPYITWAIVTYTDFHRLRKVSAK